MMPTSNFSLLLDLYELTMAEAYFRYKPDTCATFDLFVRDLPAARAYLVAAGLQDVLGYLQGLRFGPKELSYLKGLKVFSDDFLRYLKRFRFSGDVWALPEGTVCFPQEPIIRVTAPIIEAQVVESFLLNTVNLQTMIASKASRVVLAAKGRKVFDFSLRRTHGADAGIKAARCSYLAGFDGTANCLAGRLYAIPVAGTMAHSFVMSFKHELDSFLAYAHTFPERTILLVDTYDTKRGIENAIKTSLYLKSRGCRLQGIRLDSGDLAFLSKLARRMLDKAGLRQTMIFGSGNLDEFRIKDLLARGACFDAFGVGTNMGTSIDAPCLDVIYKISEVTDEEGNFLPTMKLSRRKVSYPGRKQVFRIKDARGRCVRDVIALEYEKIPGVPLLRKVMERGRRVGGQPDLKQIREYARQSLASFPEGLKEVYPAYRYPVAISPGLKRLRDALSRQLEGRAIGKRRAR